MCFRLDWEIAHSKALQCKSEQHDANKAVIHKGVSFEHLSLEAAVENAKQQSGLLAHLSQY
jgi:hypothetical protein